jgi:hypothetical protein
MAVLGFALPRHDAFTPFAKPPSGQGEAKSTVDVVTILENSV